MIMFVLELCIYGAAFLYETYFSKVYWHYCSSAADHAVAHICAGKKNKKERAVCYWCCTCYNSCVGSWNRQLCIFIRLFLALGNITGVNKETTEDKCICKTG